MERWAVTALKTIIALAVAGSAIVQVVLLATLRAADQDPQPALRVQVTLLAVLGIGCLQAIAVSIWRLLTMVRVGTVFSRRAFRYVDIVVAALATCSALVFAVAVAARLANRRTPGDEMAPGVVAFVCGLALVVAGVSLVVYVLRVLLAQAVATDARAKHLQAELDEVI
jgi:hypothetical protein